LSQAREAFASLFLLFLVFVIGVGAFLYYRKQQDELLREQQKEQRIKEWEKEVFAFFDKRFPNLKCYCTIRKGKRREKIDFLETVSRVIDTCSNALEKYPEDAFAIRSACTKWITLHFDGLHKLDDYPKLLDKGLKERERELKELQNRFTEIRQLIEKYGLISALVLSFLTFGLIISVVGLNRKLGYYLELKEKAETELASVNEKAGAILKQAKRDGEFIVSKATKESQEIIRRAQEKAKLLVDEARERAEKIVEQAQEYGELLKKQALEQVESELESLRKQNEEMKGELARLKSNLNNPVYFASYLTENDERLKKFVRALVKQKEAERVQKELRKALRKGK